VRRSLILVGIVLIGAALVIRFAMRPPVPQADEDPWQEETVEVTSIRPAPAARGRWNLSLLDEPSRGTVAVPPRFHPDEEQAATEAVRTAIQARQQAAGTEFNLRGLPTSQTSGGCCEDRTVRVQVIEPAVFTAECVRAVQNVLASHYPLWRVWLDCDEDDREPDLMIYPDAVVSDVAASPPTDLEPVVNDWQTRVAEFRAWWAGPLERQTRYCLEQLPQALQQLTPEEPVALLGVFDNVQGDFDLTAYWVLHLGGPEAIGIFSHEDANVGRALRDILVHERGEVIAASPPPLTPPYATLVCWTMREPRFEFQMGPYVRSGRQLVVREGTWILRSEPGQVVTDEALREAEKSADPDAGR